MSDEISEGAPRPISPRRSDEIAEGAPQRTGPLQRYPARHSGDSDPDFRLLSPVVSTEVVIIACVQAYRGVRFRYPLTIRIFPHPHATHHSDEHVDID